MKSHGVSNPKVTIAVPAYNAEAFVGQTLDSVARQNHTVAFEVLVVDDASTDGTAAVVEAHPLRPTLRVNTKNIGPTATFNRCIELARGDYLLILHADDLLEPDFLRLMVPILDKHSDVDLAFCLAKIVDGHGAIVGRQRPPFARAGVVTNPLFVLGLMNLILTPTALVRKATYARLGGFNVNLRHAADYEMWLRIAGAGRVYALPRYLARYRLHSASHTHSVRKPDAIRERLAALSEGLQRSGLPVRRRVRFLEYTAALVLAAELRALAAGVDRDFRDVADAIAQNYPRLWEDPYYRFLRTYSLWPRWARMSLRLLVRGGSRASIELRRLRAAGVASVLVPRSPIEDGAA